MGARNQSCKLRASVELEIDSRLIRLADRLDLKLSELLEEALRSRLEDSEQFNSISVSDISLNLTYRNLIGKHPVSPVGLRNCFEKSDFG